MASLLTSFREPSLNLGKEFVKNVKASKSVCYGHLQMLYSAREDQMAVRTQGADGPPGRAASGAGIYAVSLGRPGQRRRARAHAAQPRNRRGPVPSRVRR